MWPPFTFSIETRSTSTCGSEMAAQTSAISPSMSSSGPNPTTITGTARLAERIVARCLRPATVPSTPR